jgi:putative transcriptional regulator
MNKFLDHQFLIAMPELKNEDFFQTVTYICQHNDEGAVGIVLNRLTELTLNDIFEQMEITDASEKSRHMPVHLGGPLKIGRSFIIHNNNAQIWDSSIAISKTVSLTSSSDILEAIAYDKGPEHYFICLGYSSWEKDQLETEMINNAWLNTAYDASILYETPVDRRWTQAAKLIGIDITLLTAAVGHG